MAYCVKCGDEVPDVLIGRQCNIITHYECSNCIQVVPVSQKSSTCSVCGGVGWLARICKGDIVSDTEEETQSGEL
jgi:hypothetical protein